MEKALNINQDTIRINFYDDLSKTTACAKFVSHTLSDEQNSTIAKILETLLQPSEMIQTFSNQLLPVMKHDNFNTALQLSSKMPNGSVGNTSFDLIASFTKILSYNIQKRYYPISSLPIIYSMINNGISLILIMLQDVSPSAIYRFGRCVTEMTQAQKNSTKLFRNSLWDTELLLN